MEKVINIVICDDDRKDLEYEYKMVCEVLKKIHIECTVDCFSNSTEIKNSDNIYDIAFLDIEMPDGNGLDVAKCLLKRNKKCIIMFITNYSVYLDNAFDVNAFRFLPKPVIRERLCSGIVKAVKKIKDEENIIYVTECINKREVAVKIKSILFIENSNRHTRIVTEEKDFTAKEPFSKVKKIIDTNVDYFASSHNSIFVNLNYVVAHDRLSVSVLRNGDIIKLDMSRRQYTGFIDKLFLFAENIQ